MSDSIFIDVESLTSELKSRFVGRAIIGIDAWPGAGKTTLARELSWRFKGASVDTDFFRCDEKIEKYSYVDSRKYCELKKSIIDRDYWIFIAGICLVEIMERLEIRPDIFIYVKSAQTLSNRA